MYLLIKLYYYVTPFKLLYLTELCDYKNTGREREREREGERGRDDWPVVAIRDKQIDGWTDIHLDRQSDRQVEGGGGGRLLSPPPGHANQSNRPP